MLLIAFLILSLLLPAAQPVAHAQGCEGEGCTHAVAENPDVARYTTYAMVSSTGTVGGSTRPVEIEWTTPGQTFNAGFNIVGVEFADGFVAVNDKLIPSTVIDSLAPQSYSYTAAFAGDEFYLESRSPLRVSATVAAPSRWVKVWGKWSNLKKWTGPRVNAASAVWFWPGSAQLHTWYEESNAALDASATTTAASPDEPLVEQWDRVLGEYDILVPLIGTTTTML